MEERKPTSFFISSEVDWSAFTQLIRGMTMQTDEQELSKTNGLLQSLPDVQKELFDLHSTVSEILRHFWGSVQGRDIDTRRKNQRMADLLKDLKEKVNIALSRYEMRENDPMPVLPGKVLQSLVGPIDRALMKAKELEIAVASAKLAQANRQSPASETVMSPQVAPHAKRQKT